MAESTGLRPFMPPETLSHMGGLATEAVALNDILVDWLSSQVVFKHLCSTLYTACFCSHRPSKASRRFFQNIYNRMRGVASTQSAVNANFCKSNPWAILWYLSEAPNLVPPDVFSLARTCSTKSPSNSMFQFNIQASATREHF